jgi:hypothetical protein
MSLPSAVRIALGAGRNNEEIRPVLQIISHTASKKAIAAKDIQAG